MNLACGAHTIRVLLFQNVADIASILQSARETQLQCTLLDAEMILSPFLIELAVFKALSRAETNTMTTKSISTEVVVCLSGARSISDAFKKFGIQSATKFVLAVLVDPTPEAISTVSDLIGGELTDWNPDQLANTDKIRKVYKVPSIEEETSGLLSAVSTRMAVFDC
eukprot:c47426_g1_i1.p1 GENE.c47426_g1_i1~~c47426_g1_i1.p1  ORF type:complete len:167 (+),score=39.05 c47426_g1_i1:39-539(+)